MKYLSQRRRINSDINSQQGKITSHVVDIIDNVRKVLNFGANLLITNDCKHDNMSSNDFTKQFVWAVTPDINIFKTLTKSRANTKVVDSRV